MYDIICYAILFLFSVFILKRYLFIYLKMSRSEEGPQNITKKALADIYVFSIFKKYEGIIMWNME